jgi:nicotinate phosphoribosyltransferase
MGFISDIYSVAQTTPLLTDRYHFTTTYAYWLEGRADNPAVFYMFGRKEALQGGYTVAAGLEGVIDIVQRWQKSGFTEEDCQFLRSQTTPSGKPQFPDEFLTYLRQMQFKLKVDAAPEGTVFFPQEPILRVEGPIAQAKMLESVALCLINGHSGYATHAARQSDVIAQVLPNGSPPGVASVQGLRRGPSLGAALEASRSLGLGGYTTTSTGTAAKQFGQVFAGTMDHAWVMTHKRELAELPLSTLFRLQQEGRTEELQHRLTEDAFRSFALAYPESGILLLDTYDPSQGLEHAITVIKELRALGLGRQYGVRFDSGDLVASSKHALRRFAEEGFVEGLTRATVDALSDAELLKHAHRCSVFCVAADGINEYTAREMRESGAFFTAWGIGTAGSHVASLGLVYKASAVYMEVLSGRALPADAAMTPVMKVVANAPVKSSNPGRINSRRTYDETGELAYIMLYDESIGLDPTQQMVNLRDFADVRIAPPTHTMRELLVPIFTADGAYVYHEPPKKESFPGSGKLVTDLTAIAQFVKQQLATLPASVRQVIRPREERIGHQLLAAFIVAKAAGQARLSLDIAAVEAEVPAGVDHIPIYLDMNLFQQRLACEQRHTDSSSAIGVELYRERFEQ